MILSLICRTSELASAGAAGRAVRRPIAVPPAHAHQYAVRMPDGTLLATDVYLPKPGKGPVLLSRLPYDKAGAECFMPEIADWFTDRGYVVVVQDVRGKLRSGGALAPFESEVSDGYHTIDWITDQPWSTGPIGMFGDSYYGFTQWAAAASGHPALGAIAPRVTSADFAPTFARQGVFALELETSWALETWVDEALYEYEDQLDWMVRPQCEIAPRLLGGRRPVGLDAWAEGRIPSAATVPVSGAIPALHLGGFDDVLLRGQLSTWRAAALGPGPNYLVLDARDHGWTARRPDGEPYLDRQASADGRRRFLDEYLNPLLPFFDHFLRGRGLFKVAPVRWRTDSGEWHEDATWPPRETVREAQFLVGSGRLARGPQESSPTVGWRHDPQDPVPSLVHPYYPLIERVDERATPRRPDVLCFQADPTTHAIRLLGPAHVDLVFTSSANGAHVMATLYDVAPEGRTLRIADGAVLARGPWPAPLRIELGDLGYDLVPGHRLALTLAGSSFPRYLLHPGNDSDPWTTTDVECAEHAITIGGETSSQLVYHTSPKELR